MERRLTVLSFIIMPGMSEQTMERARNDGEARQDVRADLVLAAESCLDEWQARHKARFSPVSCGELTAQSIEALSFVAPLLSTLGPLGTSFIRERKPEQRAFIARRLKDAVE